MTYTNGLDTPPARARALTDLIEVLTGSDNLIARLQEDPTDEAVDLALDALRKLCRGQSFPRQTRDELITALADNARTLNLDVIGKAAGVSDAMVSRIAVNGGAAPRTYRPRREAKPLT
ncbi:hypothetical protein AB0395_35005 [Streptosporangium sp. NPDC051023]|uniref:hypothetical protein n=1 Tax=Streptosporangium sp. NPDC051023 TaxID=3155410 RepID=UPI00344E7C95